MRRIQQVTMVFMADDECLAKLFSRSLQTRAYPALRVERLPNKQSVAAASLGARDDTGRHRCGGLERNEVSGGARISIDKDDQNHERSQVSPKYLCLLLSDFSFSGVVSNCF